MAAPRPYGRGPYGASVYATYRTYEIGGLSQVAFGAAAIHAALTSLGLIAP
jgi:hypothetical protein